VKENGRTTTITGAKCCRDDVRMMRSASDVAADAAVVVEDLEIRI